MIDNLVIRHYIKGDEANIIKLLDSVFNGWPGFDLNCSKLDHWNWKYLDNPAGMKDVIVCSNDEEIIASLGDYPRYIKLLDKTIRCSDSVDATVHPDFRGRRIYTKMEKMMEEHRIKSNSKIFTGIGGNPILIKRSKRQGDPDFPQPVIKLVRIKDISLHAKKKNIEISTLKKIGYMSLKSAHHLKKIFQPKNEDIEIKLKEINTFQSNIDEFWNKIKVNYDYILVRNNDFLNWRFCDSRNSNYRIIQAHDENDILGYCVTRINRLIKGYPEGFIVDVITEPKRKDVAKALIFDAISHCDEQGVNAISCLMVNKNTYNDILLNYGFVNSRSNFNVGLREVTPSIRDDLQKLYSANADRIDYQYVHTDWI